MRTRSWAAASLAVVLTMLLAGCQWMSTGWDASGSADDTAESRIGVGRRGHAAHRVDGDARGDGLGLAASSPVASGNDAVRGGPTRSGPGHHADCRPTRPPAAPAARGVHRRPARPCGEAAGHVRSRSPWRANGVVYVDNSWRARGLRRHGGPATARGAPLVCTAALWSGAGTGAASRSLEDGRVYVAGGRRDRRLRRSTPAGARARPLVCHPIAVYQQRADVCAAPRLSCPVAALVADGTIGCTPPPVFTRPRSPSQFTNRHHHRADHHPVPGLAYDIGGSSDPRVDPGDTTTRSIRAPPCRAALMDVGGQIYATWWERAPARAAGPRSSGMTAFTRQRRRYVPSGQSSVRVGACRRRQPGRCVRRRSVVASSPAVPGTGCGAATGSDPLTPLRSYDAGSLRGHRPDRGPVVANGVLYAGGNDATLGLLALRRQRATPRARRSPVVCQPLATIARALGGERAVRDQWPGVCGHRRRPADGLHGLVEPGPAGRGALDASRAAPGAALVRSSRYRLSSRRPATDSVVVDLLPTQ